MAGVKLLNFQPQRHPDLMLEVMTMAELRQRLAHLQLLARPQRINFHSLMLFTAGNTGYFVDFQSYLCQQGCVLHIYPNQMFHLTIPDDLEGIVIIYEDTFLSRRADSADTRPAPTLWNFFTTSDFSEQEGRDVWRSFAELQHTYIHYADDTFDHAIMQYQLLILLTRLARIQAKSARPAHAGNIRPLMAQFNELLEQQFRQTRKLSDYAHQLHCSPRTLNRLIVTLTEQSGKEYINNRVLLEAKRLLVHTDFPIGEISETLGFSEPTNFIKFFQHLEGVSPGKFRHSAPGTWQSII